MTTGDVVTWTHVCAVDAVPPGGVAIVDVDPPVAVWNVDGDFYATDDDCTHEKYSLSEGYIDGCEVECALHWARFDVRTGAALCMPATRALATYPVRVANGEVHIDLSGRGAAR